MSEGTFNEDKSGKPHDLELYHTIHNSRPDYTRPLLKIPAKARKRMLGRLRFLYGDAEAERWMPELERIMRVYFAHKPARMIELEKDFDPQERFTEKDIMFITYGDLLHAEGHTGLAALHNFFLAQGRKDPLFSILHILPFFPYSSDRGFSVVDFRRVDPSLGTWQDIEELGKRYKLMFDGVLNHVSSHSPAFQEFLNGSPDHKDIVTAYHSPDELTPEQRKIIVRPRTSALLTKFQSMEGPVWVWTTFSADQVDLNYKDPRVLMFIIETVLIYVRRGADLLRLDAVTYLWAEPGTPSVHLEQTHEIIKLFRDVLDVVAPGVALVTETNVPHKENVSYFGKGSDEAQMIYNFALPPLVLHTFYREDTTAITKWARDLEYPSKTTTFLNMLDTHDGVGLMGVKGILAKEDIDFIVQTAREHGAFISNRSVGGGEEEPYEINITWFSAINHDNSDEDMAFQVKRFVASRSIALVLRGVPGIYFHGMLGTKNDIDAVLRSKVKRNINRRTLDEGELLQKAKDPNSKLSHILYQLGRLAELRVQNRAFHPNGDQQVMMLSKEVFAVLRTSPDGEEHILCLTNVANNISRAQVTLSELGIDEAQWYDLYGKRGWMAKGKKLDLTLQPYDVVWLIPFVELERSIES
jgi:sucrose phosphorylase